MEKEKYYPKVSVFITKKGTLRAEIQDSQNSPKWQISLGGKRWINGEADMYKFQIYMKCNEMLLTIKENQNKAFPDGIRSYIPKM